MISKISVFDYNPRASPDKPPIMEVVPKTVPVTETKPESEPETETVPAPLPEQIAPEEVKPKKLKKLYSSATPPSDF